MRSFFWLLKLYRQPFKTDHKKQAMPKSIQQENIREKVVGVAGFEPAHDEIKTRCLTAWLHPIRNYFLKDAANISRFAPTCNGDFTK